jgi:hypothetical protein
MEPEIVEIENMMTKSQEAEFVTMATPDTVVPGRRGDWPLPGGLSHLNKRQLQIYTKLYNCRFSKALQLYEDNTETDNF